MGENEGWAQPSGIVPSGLLPNEGGEPLIRILDRGRWLKAEKITAELISCIQPNPISEARRKAVTGYVVKLVTKCFLCKVASFGSVPLKTYLPDGDIDLTIFTNDQTAKDTWANIVCDMLEREEKNVNAEFHVKEVQYIQAEVKLVKCLVDNIVVDISFNQLGGLCTLCFLEEVNSLIKNDFLFKRSIILVKAWCYYESRILGAHHGLISTYALETLVLYIFHVYNNSFAGPLEVLYRFLEFFSNFDWENFCISLWGPVPVKSLPDMTSMSPRKDSGELLLKKTFLEACYRTYHVVPGVLETNGPPFGPKVFNVIDPLRVNNNLGRSVSKGNFFRIRSAFAFGAKRLARLLDCPKDEIYLEVNIFFMNTWSRHGSGMRPDTHSIDIGESKVTQIEPSYGCENNKNDLWAGSVRSNEAGFTESYDNSDIPHYGKGTKIMTSSTDVISCAHDRKGYPNSSSCSGACNSGLKIIKSSNKGKNNVMAERDDSDGQIKFSLARTHSSPELHNEDRSQGKSKMFMQSGNTFIGVGKGGNKRSSVSKILERDNIKSLVEVPSSSTHKNARADEDFSIPGKHHDDLQLVIGQGAPVEKHIVKQKEQDIRNIPMVFSQFNGAVSVPQPHFPLNSSAAHLPVPIASFLASAGYIPRNIPGGFSGNPLIEHPWRADIQIAQGMLPPQMAHYFPDTGHNSNLEDFPTRFNEQLSFTEINSDAENDTWIHDEHDVSSSGGFDMDNESVDMQAIEDQLQSNSSRVGSSHSASGSGNLIKNNKFPRETERSMTTESVDSFQYSHYTDNDFSFDRQTHIKNQSISRHSSLRSRTSSESSWDESSAKTSKTAKEKSRKIILPDTRSAAHRKDNVVEGNTNLAAIDAYRHRDRSTSSTVGNNLLERDTILASVAPSNISRHQFPGSESTIVNGSGVVPLSPMVLGPSQKKPSNDSGAPFTFFPTGPPVPFFTMLPLYNFPSETLTSERSGLLVKDDGLSKTEYDRSVELLEMHDKSEDISTSDLARKAPTQISAVDQQSDILSGDFLHHLRNLYYGRSCQVPNQVHPPAAVVPPMYLQGQVPWVGSGRTSANLNQMSQYMSYGPRVGPLAPFFPAMTYRPVNPYQQFADEMPRYRSGTGTYLPNHAHTREQQSSGTRRGYNHDRSDHNIDREGHWNHNKLRAAGRNHTRSLADKTSPRLDLWAINESRADRSTSSYSISDSFPTQNGHLNPDISGSGTLAYVMHPKVSGFRNAVSSNGPSISPMMVYPYDQYRGYGVSTDQLEFGSLGQVGQASTSGGNEVATDQSYGNFDEQRYHSRHAQRASPDQLSSPQLQRRS